MRFSTFLHESVTAITTAAKADARSYIKFQLRFSSEYPHETITLLSDGLRNIAPNDGILIDNSDFEVDFGSFWIWFCLKDGEDYDGNDMVNKLDTKIREIMGRELTTLQLDSIRLLWKPMNFKFKHVSHKVKDRSVTVSVRSSDLAGIHEKLEANVIRIYNNGKVKHNILDILKIPKLEMLFIADNIEAWQIIAKHVKNPNISQRVSEATEDLFNAGFKDLI